MGTHLGGADLGESWLTSKTVLNHATLDHTTSLGDIHWGGVGAVDLTQIDWELVPKLGDEGNIELPYLASVTRRAIVGLAPF